MFRFRCIRVWVCLWLSFLGTMGGAAARGADAPGAAPLATPASPFHRENLVAWCIVPFDAKQRTPEQRAEMLGRLGLRRLAYDWRERHVAEFGREIEATRKAGIEFLAFWGVHDRAIELFADHKVSPQLWMTAPSPAGASHEQRVEAAGRALLPLARRAKERGLPLGLYNHGGWGGEPVNLLAVCRWLRRETASEHVGIVYNLHHAHADLDAFLAHLKEMVPLMQCLNLNGMKRGGPKILPVGEGKEDARILRAIRESGYLGPVGVLNHLENEDAEVQLRRNLDGLRTLLKEMGDEAWRSHEAPVGAGVGAGGDATVGSAGPAPSPEGVGFSRELIAPIAVASEGHVGSVRNGVRFDVYFDKGPKTSAAIYAINTGRRQIALTRGQHKAILEDLIRRKFTVIVADFRDKRLAGLELERYVVQLTADARAAADGVPNPGGSSRPPAAPRVPPPTSSTETYADDYFTLMPGFTVERDVTWFRYGDIPEAFRREIARQLDKPFNEADADKTNTYDIIYPAHGPAVGVLTNYASDERGRETFHARENRYLVQAFAFKNLAVVHQQYFNDPVGGYPKGYGYYGDQFAVSFIRHLKGNARKYHIDPQRICAFGHSKGSEVPGMLVNRLRATPPHLYGKVDFKRLGLSAADKTLRSAHGDMSTEIACAIFGAGVANNELLSDKTMPWAHDPARHISPFFVYADHGSLMRERTRNLVAKARAQGVSVETAEMDAHTWPIAEVYDRASAFADRMLRLEHE